MAGSTRGMAVLLLLCILSVPATANLSIYQTRVAYNPIMRETFRVEGVATVSIGGSSLPDFFFDCNNTANNGSGIRWSRQSGSDIVTELGTVSGRRVLLQNVDYDDLDVYNCTDTFTGESVALNITAGNPAICPVESVKITQEGRQVQLEVYISSYPLPTSNHVRWLRPDGSEISESDLNVRFANSRKTLILDDLRLANFGKYEVEYTLDLGPLIMNKARTQIFLDIQVPPEIDVQPVNVTTISERASFSLSCTAVGNPPPSIMWVREDNIPLNTLAEISSTTTPGMPRSFVNSILVVPVSLYSDSGRYRCSADNAILNPVLSDYAQIIVRPTLSLSAYANNEQLLFSDVISQPDNSAFTVICHGSGVLTWFGSSDVPISINQADDVFQVFNSTLEQVILNFISFSSSQVDMYTCQSGLTDENNMPITETVLITNSDLAVFIASDVEYVLDGMSVSIEAGVSVSSTTPDVQWFLNGVMLNVDSDLQLTQVVTNASYTLTINSISSEYVGVIRVDVTIGNEIASDSINITYATAPTVSVSQTELEVTEGEEIRVQCQGNGVGLVVTRWFHNDEESSFQVGTDLVIPSSTSSNAGRYECRVSNIAATMTIAVQISVKYNPFSMIRYNSVSSMSSPTISVVFGENTVAPIFMCVSDGYPVPTISWRATRETGFPNGVTTQNNERQLVWTRPLEYTDSMQYECVSENELGMSVTTMELLVQSPPRIDSIYSSHLSLDTPNNFKVPTGFTGLALTCLVFGWPTPHVEWLFEGGALPNGVVSSKSILLNMGQASANLRFRTGFNSSFNGAYQCIVRENEQSDVAVREQRQLVETSVTSTGSPPSICSVNSPSINFQIRILETDCNSWGNSLRESISNAFEDDIARIVQMECNCTLESGFVQNIETTCSTMVANSVVFRGTIETNLADLTEQAYCALSNWQQSSPSININSQFFIVDSDCFLEVDSFSTPECSASSPNGPLDTATLIIVIAAPLGAVLLIVFVILIISCVCCCRRNTKKETWMPKEGLTDSVYSRTDIRYGRNNHVVGPTDEANETPIYSSLNRNIYSPPYGAQPLLDDSPDHLALKQTGSLSKERLLRHHSGDHESIDGDIRFVQSAIDSPNTNGGGQFPYDSRPSTGLSDRVISLPQGASSNVLSATNPIPKYETLDNDFRGSVSNPHPQSLRRTSGSDNPNDRKFSLASSITTGTGTGTLHSSSVGRDDVFVSESGSQSRSTISNQAPVSTAYLRNINSRSSIDHHSASPATSSRPSELIDEEERRDSNCSEELPPYTSRSSSLGGALSSSMLDNSAYRRVDPPAHIAISSEGDQSWYLQSSDVSINSGRHESRNLNHVNGRSTEILPYASIHNSAIPYEPHTVRAQNEPSSASPRFRLSANERRRHMTQPQPYTEPINSQSSITTPQPYSEAVPDGMAPQLEANIAIGSSASQGSFGATRNNMPKFERITVVV